VILTNQLENDLLTSGPEWPVLQELPVSLQMIPGLGWPKNEREYQDGGKIELPPAKGLIDRLLGISKEASRKEDRSLEGTESTHPRSGKDLSSDAFLFHGGIATDKIVSFHTSAVLIDRNPQTADAACITLTNLALAFGCCFLGWCFFRHCFLNCHS
jgi:hypothetical protein